MMKKTILLFFFILIHLFSGAFNRGIPYLEVYTKEQYKAENQNWNIAEDSRGIKYFANSLGLLEFDGYQWQLHSLPNKMIVRSVYVDRDDKIYVGAYEEFGYFQRVRNGTLVYTSLSKKLRKDILENSEVWRIYQANQEIYFQSFTTLFVTDEDRIEPIHPPGLLLFIYKYKQQLYCQVVDDKLYRINGREFELVKGSDILQNKRVVSLCEFQNKMLIVTSDHGLIINDNKQLYSWNCAASELGKKYKFNSLTKINDNLYALGTILHGLVFINEKGEVVNQLGIDDGLSNNTILSSFYDKEGNLWVGTDNGINRLDLSNSIRFFTTKSFSQLGASYDAVIFDGYLYLATNRGLYRIRYKQGNLLGDIEFVNNSQGQVWSLFKYKRNLIVGHNDGTYLVNKGQFEKISNVSGGWKMQIYKSLGRKFIIQSSYNGLDIYDGENIRNPPTHLTHLGPINDFEIDFQGNIWASHLKKSIYKVQLNKACDSVVSVEYFGKNKGLPNEFNVEVAKIDGRVVFSTKNGFYTYDDIQDSVVLFKSFNEQLPKNYFPAKYLKAGKKSFIITQGSVNEVVTENGQLLKIQSNLPNKLLPKLIYQYENIVEIEEQTYLVCLDNGFAIFKGADTDNKETIHQLYFKEIVASNSATGENLYLNLEKEKSLIPYAFRNIKIQILRDQLLTQNINYQYWIEGLDSDLKLVSKELIFEYKRLPFGEYTFVVQQLRNGQEYGDPLRYKFRIVAPWYLSYRAVVLYSLFFIAFSILTIFQIRKRIKARHNKRVEEVEHNRLLLQREVDRLNNEKLESEVEHKSRELAGALIGISKKNEILIKLKSEIEIIIESMGSRFPKRYSEKLLSLIENSIEASDDIKLFEDNFNRSHQDFLKKMKAIHQELNPNDLRFCAYLRLNIPSKKLASLLNISMRGLEAKRYRIRQKLNISQEDNLIEYIMKI